MDPQQPRTVQKCAHVTPETTMEAEQTPRGPADPAPRRFDSTTRRPPDTHPTPTRHPADTQKQPKNQKPSLFLTLKN